ncbi:MAG: adenylate/guanylate cyclase domain-containing protein [Armatimonadetes bacterium]|nr:adenylate/guanylate cyclase domain-containing protein [Armatimonadota bacterium]
MKEERDEALSPDQLRSVRKLRFEPELEAAFTEQHTGATIGRVRIVFAFLAFFGLLGVVARKPSNDPATAIVDISFTAFFFVLLGMAYAHRLRHFATPSLAIAAVLSQVAVGLTSKSPDPAAGIIINLLYLIIIVATLQTRFRIALLVCASMVAARAWTFSYRDMWNGASTLLFVFLVAEAVFLCLASYLNEMRDRRSFLLERSLVAEKERSKELVRNVLPPSIADRLATAPGIIAEHHQAATVLFCDITGFTPFAASKPPETVVGLLNDLFSRFDALVQQFEVVKIKTIGDCYMVAGGIPDPCENHVAQVADLALELRGTANVVGVDVRIGFHTGPVIAGVLGTERLMYDLWGPTVNLASRLEGSALPGTIAVSDAVRDALAETYEFDGPFDLELKGIGKTAVWHLTRRRIRDLALG